MTLTPAYGRDYKSKKEVTEAFQANADFIIADVVHPDSGRYVNRPQLIEAGERSVNIRYKRLTQVAVVKVA